MIKMEKQGRHRYYGLFSCEIAQILESLLSISTPPKIRSLKQSSQMKALKSGRTCYDHLAGELGVKLTETMQDAGYLQLTEKEWRVTQKGEQFFTEFGLDLNTLRKKRREFSRVCLDWSERKYHLAGALGSELTSRWFELGWIDRKGTSRAVTMTSKGQEEFKNKFGVKM